MELVKSPERGPAVTPWGSQPSRLVVKAVGLGLVASMRSMMAPALVSRQYTRLEPGKLTGSPLAFMDSPRTAVIFSVLAGGELIGDKLPNTPNRTDPGAATGRIGSGALCGATIATAERQQPWLGALAGGLGALIGTYAFYHLRHWLVQETGVADKWVALAEDALAIGTGVVLMNAHQPVADSE